MVQFGVVGVVECFFDVGMEEVGCGLLGWALGGGVG